MVALQWFRGTWLLPCLVEEEASWMILGCTRVCAESREWDLPKPSKVDHWQYTENIFEKYVSYQQYSLEWLISTHNLSNWCWCTLITPKSRRRSMWRAGMGLSWAWQMVELFIANSYPMKLGFFSVQNWLETNCGFSVCMIYSRADELRNTCSLCFSVIGSAVFSHQEQMIESFAKQRQ